MMLPSAPSPWAWPRLTMKLNAPYGLSRNVGMAPSSARRGGHGVARPLADAEDHELRRLHRRYADQADHPPVVQVVLGHRGAVAADEVGLLRLLAQQRPVLPLHQQEVLDRAPDVVPQPVA